MIRQAYAGYQSTKIQKEHTWKTNTNLIEKVCTDSAELSVKTAKEKKKWKYNKIKISQLKT